MQPYYQQSGGYAPYGNQSTHPQQGMQAGQQPPPTVLSAPMVSYGTRPGTMGAYGGAPGMGMTGPQVYRAPATSSNPASVTPNTKLKVLTVGATASSGPTISGPATISSAAVPSPSAMASASLSAGMTDGGDSGTVVLPAPGSDGKPMLLPRRRGMPAAMNRVVHLRKGKKVIDPNAPKHLRRCAGKVWSDTTLDDWPQNGFRFFVGDLGNECTDEILTAAFKRYASFQKAKIITDKKTGKSKGYGFVQIGSSDDALRCLKEMHRKYVGNRPITVIRSRWKDREIGSDKNKMLSHLKAEMTEASKATRKFKKIAKTTK